MSLAGARTLAGQLRDAAERRHAVAAARAGQSLAETQRQPQTALRFRRVRGRACALDLHAPLPVPGGVLRLGPDHPDALAWLWAHWGATAALRHVAAGPVLPRRAAPGDPVTLDVTFWSADWTPWRALMTVGRALARAALRRPTHLRPAVTGAGDGLPVPQSDPPLLALAETLIAGKERFFFEHFIKVHATNQDVFTAALLDLHARSCAKPESLHAAFEYCRALNETERRDAPPAGTKLAVPVLAIGGGGHGGFGTAQADQVRQYATHVEGLSLPGRGHWLPEECAGPLNQAVVGFLGRQ